MELIFKSKGIDVRIDPTAQITRPELIELGNHISIDMGCYISVSAVIGDWIHIAPHVCVIGGADALLIMEDFSAIATGSKLVCASDDFTKGFACPFIPREYRNVINKPIILKKYAIIGINCSIMPGIVMAEGSCLGAGSVLTKDTEPWTIYVGSPAKPVKIRDSELILRGAREMGY